MIEIIKYYSREAISLLYTLGQYIYAGALAAWNWLMLNPLYANLLASITILSAGYYFFRPTNNKKGKKAPQSKE